MDDGFGWHVAEQLRNAGLTCVVPCHQLTPELAEPVRKASRVVFIDARHGEHSGRVSCARVLPDARPDLAFSHSPAPGRLLRLAAELYGACPSAWMITVDGENFGHGTELSATVQATIPTVVSWLDKLARQESESPSPHRHDG
jgi:hydrogenase maturation protease